MKKNSGIVERPVQSRDQQKDTTGEIPEGWEEIPFSKAVIINPGVSLTRGNEYPFVDMQAVSATSRCAYASVRRPFGGGGSRFVAGDTLMARITPCLENGKIARFFADDGMIAHGSTEFIVIRGRDKVTDTDFAFYLTKWEGVRGYAISQMTGTSGRQRVPTESLNHLLVPLPPLEEQRAIAKILGDLDDKIELNHRMNKTLEAIAQALFKRWFVDFNFPGCEETKRMNGLPEGWCEGKLTDVCSIVMGQSPPGESYNESGDGIIFYQGNRDFGFRFPTPRVYCTAPTRIAEAGDILISVRAPVGALNITLERCAIGRGVAALRMKNYSNGFLFCFLTTRQDLWDQFNSEGTVFGCLNKTEFHKISLVIPSEEVMKQFDQVVKPIEAMIQKNELEARLLEKIRDSLLPKLMSGKIRVNHEWA